MQHFKVTQCRTFSPVHPFTFVCTALYHIVLRIAIRLTLDVGRSSKFCGISADSSALYCQRTARAQDKLGVFSWILCKTSIVGYATTATRLHGNTMGLSFVQIGGDNDMDLTKISVVGYAEKCSGEFQIQTLDEYGRTIKQYDWHDFDKKGSHYLGWYNLTDGKYVEEGEVVFPAGKGLWVSISVEGLSLMCNGQVLTDAQTVKLQDHTQLVGNPYPVDVPLLNMWASGYKEDAVGKCSGEVQIQTLDEYGRTLKQYDWHDFNKKGTDYYGWYNLTDGKYVTADDNLVLKAGAAYWVSCTMAEGRQFYLNFPAILTDAK